MARNPLDDSLLFASLLDALPDAVYVKDAGCRYVRVNAVLARWYRLPSPEAAVGKTDADFFPPSFAQSLQEADRALLKSREGSEHEERSTMPDGRARWCVATRRPLRSGRKVVGILGLLRDIGAQKKAEERTKDSDALYQSLIECLPQCIFRKDAEGRYVYVNRQLCEALGHPPEALIGKTDYDVNPRPLAEKYRTDDKYVMQSQKLLDTVEEFKPHKQKKTVRIRVTKTPVYDSSGRVIGVQGIFWPV